MVKGNQDTFDRMHRDILTIDGVAAVEDISLEIRDNVNSLKIIFRPEFFRKEDGLIDQVVQSLADKSIDGFQLHKLTIIKEYKVSMTVIEYSQTEMKEFLL